MAGHGEKFGRKQEEAIAALLSQRNLEDAARVAPVAVRDVAVATGPHGRSDIVRTLILVRNQRTIEEMHLEISFSKNVNVEDLHCMKHER